MAAPWRSSYSNQTSGSGSGGGGGSGSSSSSRSSSSSSSGSGFFFPCQDFEGRFGEARVEISSRPPNLLFRSGSVHSGSASLDDWTSVL